MTRKPIELRVPEVVRVREPVVHRPQGFRLQPALLYASVFDSRNQASILEHVQMLQHGRHRHVERPRELADRRVAAGQAHQHRPARRVGEGAEDGVELDVADT